jgi:hypothetical protein
VSGESSKYTFTGGGEFWSLSEDEWGKWFRFLFVSCLNYIFFQATCLCTFLNGVL